MSNNTTYQQQNNSAFTLVLDTIVNAVKPHVSLIDLWENQLQNPSVTIPEKGAFYINLEFSGLAHRGRKGIYHTNSAAFTFYLAQKTSAHISTTRDNLGAARRKLEKIEGIMATLIDLGADLRDQDDETSFRLVECVELATVDMGPGRLVNRMIFAGHLTTGIHDIRKRFLKQTVDPVLLPPTLTDQS